ncbi:MAG: sugar-binding protein [Chloroflexota bacterium]
MNRMSDTAVRQQQSAVFASLQAAHNTLVKARQKSGISPQLLERAQKFVLMGRTLGQKMENAAERQQAQSMLDDWSHLLYQEQNETVPSKLAPFAPPPQVDDLTDAKNPYVGPRAFGEADQSRFFGRQAFVERLVGSFANGHLANGLLAVVGPAGSGKSSAVLAGLLPQLKNGAVAESQTWHYYWPFAPGPNPLASLASMLQGGQNGNETAPAASSGQAVWRDVRQFQRDPKHLLHSIEAAHDRPAVLVIDQFEELFTLCTKPHIRQAFVENLVELVQAPQSNHVVILTMRSEFESDVAQMAGFSPLFHEARVPMTPLAASEVGSAILEPAHLANLQFTDGVAERLVQDLVDEPVALPLLQFALAKLWKLRKGNQITRQAYTQLGGGRRALPTSANAFYESLPPEDRPVVRRILLSMVQPTAGLGVTNKRILRSSLFHGAVGEQRMAHLLDRLIDEGLVRETAVWETAVSRTNDTQIELIHETLLHNWERLAGWIEEERETTANRLPLTEAAENGEALGRQATPQLQDGPLLVEASQQVSFEEQRAKLAAEEAAAAARLKQNQARNLRRLALLGVLFVLASMAWAYFTWQRTNQAINKNIAESQATSTRIIAEQNVVSTRAAAEMLQAKETQEAAQAISLALGQEQATAYVTLTRSADLLQTRAVEVGQAEQAKQVAETAEAQALANQQAAQSAQATAESAQAAAETARVVAEYAQATAVSARETAVAEIPVLTADIAQINERNELNVQLRLAEDALETAQEAGLSTVDATARINAVRARLLDLNFGQVVALRQVPQLDGNLAGWNARPVSTLHTTNGVDFANGQAYWRFAWDNSNLYVAVLVTDVAPNTVALNMQVDVNRAGDYFVEPSGLSNDDIQLTFVPKADGSGVSTYRFRGNNEPRTIVGNLPAYTNVLENGYTLEAAVPWENLVASGTAPFASTEWGIALNLVPAQTTNRFAVNVFKSHVPGRDFDDPKTWGILIFQ